MESKLDEILGGIKQSEQERSEQVAREKAESFELVDELVSGIKAGKETSGDKLTDNVLLIYGTNVLRDPQILDRFKNVEEQLKGKRGQPIVVIERDLEGQTHVFGRGYIDHAIESKITVGKLSGTRLIFNRDEATASLPTSAYIKELHRGSDRIDGPMLVDAKKKTSMFGHKYLGHDLNVPLDLTGVNLTAFSFILSSDKQPKMLDIIAGRDNISAWALDEAEGNILSMYGQLGIVNKYCSKLGIKPITHSKDHVDVQNELRAMVIANSIR